MIIEKIGEVAEVAVVRKAAGEVGLAFRANENAEQETATITVSTNQVYAGFHACHRDQRELVLLYLKSAIEEEGSECELDEE